MTITDIVTLLNAGVPFAIAIMVFLTIRLEGHVADCINDNQALIRELLGMIKDMKIQLHELAESQQEETH